MRKSTMWFIVGGIMAIGSAIAGFVGERIFFAEESAEAIEEMKDDLLYGPDEEEK